MSNQRQEIISAMLHDMGEVRMQDLERTFPDVSTMTLRRDLVQLEQAGILRRTRGGAVAMAGLHLPAEDLFSRRMQKQIPEKMDIAHRAAALVEPGRALYIDAGTTMLLLARSLPDVPLTVFTSGINIALELATRRDMQVMMLGGRLGFNTLSVSGEEAIAHIRSVNIDLAFMSSSGFTTESGFTAGSREECRLKQEVLSRARRKVMLMDSSKVGFVLPYTFAMLKDMHMLVSDMHLSSSVAEAARAAGVQVLV